MKPTSIHTTLCSQWAMYMPVCPLVSLWYGPLTSQFFYKQASYVQLSEELLMGPCVQQKVKLAQFMSLLLSFLLTCNKHKVSVYLQVQNIIKHLTIRKCIFCTPFISCHKNLQWLPLLFPCKIRSLKKSVQTFCWLIWDLTPIYVIHSILAPTQSQILLEGNYQHWFGYHTIGAVAYGPLRKEVLGFYIGEYSIGRLYSFTFGQI